MKKVIIILFSIICFSVISYSQSRIQLDNERILFKTNKVNIETVICSDGSKSVTKYDKNGNRVEIKGYYNNVESNITIYKYDEHVNMIEESYYGYESGDGITTTFYYDESGNIFKTKTEGSDNNEAYFKYDDNGNLIKSEVVYFGEAPVVTEYKNIYESGSLVSKEDLCNNSRESIIKTNYTYIGGRVSTEEEYEKNCKTESTKFYSKKTIEYFDNGLIKETKFESSYTEGIQKTTYKYDFYNN